MEPLRPEVHSLFLRPFLDDAERILGREHLDHILETLGTSRTTFHDQNAWVSLAFCEGLFEQIDNACDDPALFERCGRLALTPRYAGILRPLFRAFNSPRFAYSQVVRATPRLNKVGQMELTRIEESRATIRYHPVDGGPRETQDRVCRARTAQLAAIPTLFDLPPAKANHPKCMLRGDDACVYELRWQTTPRRRVSTALGALLGTVAVLVGIALPLPAIATAVAGLIGLLLGWAMGRTWELRRDVASRAADIAESMDALTRSARAHEHRFAELLEAKAEVDAKVEARTRELRETSARLAAALDEVRRLDAAKTEFFSNVSHDLRTPLTLLLGPLDALREGREPPGGSTAAFESMHRNAARLLRLINQLLDLARIDAGREQLNRTPSVPAELRRVGRARVPVRCERQGGRAHGRGRRRDPGRRPRPELHRVGPDEPPGQRPALRR